MAVDKKLQVAIVLNALDNMSGPAEAAVARTIRATGKLQNANISMGAAAAIGAAGYGILRAEMGFVDKYTEQQSADTQVRIREMNNLGRVNEAAYGGEIALSKKLSQQYSKSIADYDAMISTLRRNRISSDDIIGGIGETTAKLSLAFGDLDPNKGALFFARLKNDLHVSTDEMDKMASMAYKLFQVGVGENSADAVQQLTEAYSKAGLGALNLGMHGAKDAEDLGVLMGTFIAKGLSGQTVGNNFRRIFDGLTNPEKQAKVNAAAAPYGIKLEFFDENKQFKGIDNFRKQLAKLKGLDPQAIGSILEPFSGKQGLSVDFLENMAKFGDDSDKIRDQYNNVADLAGAVKELTGTLKIQRSVLSTNVDNMEAAFGKTMQGDVSRVISLMNNMTISATDFANKHDSITSIGLEFAGLAGSTAAMYGSLRGIGYIIPGIASAAGTIATAFLGIGVSAEIFMKWADWASSQSNKEINKNPTGDRERIMAGYNKIIEDPETGFIKRQAARAMKFGIASNIALFGDDKARSDVNLNDTRKETIVGDLNRHQAADRTELQNDSKDRQVRSMYNTMWGESAKADYRSKHGDPNVYAPSSNYTPPAAASQITYAPVFNITGGDMTSEFKKAANEHKDWFTDMINSMNERKTQLTYGQ